MQVRSVAVDSDLELAGWQTVLTASMAAADPSYTPRSFEAFAASFRTPDPASRRVDLIATHDDRVVGIGTLVMPEQHNTATAWVDVHVHPDFRRRGVGSALLTALEAQAPASRTHLNAGTIVPAVAWQDSAPVRFTEGHGYSTHSHAVTRRLRLPVDAGLIGSAADVAPYRIETHVDGVPRSCFPDYGALMGMLDVEAPTGERDWDTAPVSWEDYQVGMRRCAASGEPVIESLAFSPHGELVGYSDMVVGAPGRPVAQGGTLMLREHRRHGLARALKLANLAALARLGRDNPFVETSNNQANTGMVAVNEALGFVPAHVAPEFLKTRAT